MEAAWEAKKAQLSEAVAGLILQLQAKGFARVTPGHFIGALSLESLLCVCAVGWLEAEPRRVIQAYARGLVGFEPGAAEQSERVLEQHEWMRFEIASAALRRIGAACDELSIERQARRVEWERVPKSLSELVARGEREMLEGAVGQGARGERGRL